jgi:hypothetical protein
LPILLGIKAIIIEIKTLFYSLFYGYLCVKLVNNAIVEVVKTGGNILLKGGCYVNIPTVVAGRHTSVRRFLLC